MAKFEKGESVKFFRSHDKQHELTGEVAEVKDSEVLVKTAPDSVLVWANAADVKPAEE